VPLPEARGFSVIVTWFPSRRACRSCVKEGSTNPKLADLRRG